MTTGGQIKQARQRYTKQEWSRMTGLVAPIVTNPPVGGGLDSDTGMELRDRIIIEVAEDMDYMVPFVCRMRHLTHEAERWAIEMLSEANDSLEFRTSAGACIDAISLAHADGGMAGTRMFALHDDVIGDAVMLYAYYLEDLFDDVTAAVEWQIAAMEDD